MYHSLKEDRNYSGLVFVNAFLFATCIYLYFTKPPITNLSAFLETSESNSMLPAGILLAFLLTAIVALYSFYVSFRRGMELVSYDDLKSGLISMGIGLALLFGVGWILEMYLKQFSFVLIVGGLVGIWFYFGRK